MELKSSEAIRFECRERLEPSCSDASRAKGKEKRHEERRAFLSVATNDASDDETILFERSGRTESYNSEASSPTRKGKRITDEESNDHAQVSKCYIFDYSGEQMFYF